MHLKIPFVRQELASIPIAATEHAAGYDLCSLLAKPVTIEPGKRAVIPTGLQMAIPTGHCGLICPRSGLAAKSGITVLNAPGVIDADYRGDVGVILANLGEQPFTVENGMRIAQLVLMPACKAVFIPAQALAETVRGENGFGSTGVK